MTPQDSIKIAPATLDEVADIAPLFDMYRAFYGQQPALQAAVDFITKRLVNFESVIFLARENSVAVGFTQLYPTFSSVSMEPVWILNDLFVLPDHRRKGIARYLMRAAAEHARHDNARRLVLSTAHTNTVAQALYESEGWQLDECFRTYVMPLTDPKA